MALGQVVTGGLGNGTLTTTIPLVLLRGLTPAVAPSTTSFCVAKSEAYVPGAVVGEGYETGVVAGEGC